MTRVVLRIGNLPNQASAARKALPFATVSGDGITITSPLQDAASLNEHLVWLWGQLSHERRYLRSLQGEGASLTVEAHGFQGSIEIRPNAAEMLHLLGVTLVLRAV